MAKHVILEQYAFTPATNTIVITGKNIRREQLLLITNVTAGTVIYNFSDPSLGFTGYTNSVAAITGLETTTIVLAYSTAAMNATDKLAIMTEETYQEIIPSETYRDPVDKMRVSEGQALIDTDFEYGIQPTKWEQITFLNNRPSAFYDSTQALSNTTSTPSFYNSSGTYQITNVTASTKTVTVAISNTTGITVGTPIFIQGTLDNANADGWWVVETVSANTNFTFTVTNAPAAALFDANKTYVFIGAFYTGAAIPAATNAISLSGTVATVTTTNAHGLRVGDSIFVVGVSGQTGTLLSSWTVATTPTNNTFTFACAATGTITATLNGSIYTRAPGYVEHRAYTGSVQFSNLSPYHGYQVVRQTRRQFRYQSGKAIQMSTGSILKPQLSVETITSSGSTVTVTTKFAHGLGLGGYVTVSGTNETYYSGTYAVTAVTSATVFTYTAAGTPSATPATGYPIIVSPQTWYGGSNRIGMFTEQNGFYFEYDGQTLYVVKRSSVKLTSGFSAVTNASQSVVGTNTKFSSQLTPGDTVTIRGMPYTVQVIASDTQMYIYPEYRGATAANCVVTKVINTRYAQSQWNIDRCDGTGQSLFTVDLTKMQMFYMDYTWYGAGGIRFGFKNNRGEVIYCHRIPNNNLNQEAYMRSGNLPARYETNTLPPSTVLTATLASGATASMTVASTTGFPTAGTLAVTASAATGAAIEYISYTGLTATTFTGLTRNITNLSGTAFSGGGGTASATAFTVTGATTYNPQGTAPIQVELYSPQIASIISHWGCSVIMDGKFDNDKSFVFNAGMNTPLINQGGNVRYALMSLRLGPSVDSGQVGLLGVREIVNRMQMSMTQMDTFLQTSTTTPSTARIDLILNGRPASGTFQNVGGSSLAQVAYHAGNTAIVGGESIFSFFTTPNNAWTEDLSQVRDIGQSIYGGGTTNTVSTTPAGLYPDGPDVITICANVFTGTSSVQTRVSWQEAQA
jgi:hypothetical protein